MRSRGNSSHTHTNTLAHKRCRLWFTLLVKILMKKTGGQFEWMWLWIDLKLSVIAVLAKAHGSFSFIDTESRNTNLAEGAHSLHRVWPSLFSDPRFNQEKLRKSNREGIPLQDGQTGNDVMCTEHRWHHSKQNHNGSGCLFNCCSAQRANFRNMLQRNKTGSDVTYQRSIGQWQEFARPSWIKFKHAQIYFAVRLSSSSQPRPGSHPAGSQTRLPLPKHTHTHTQTHTHTASIYSPSQVSLTTAETIPTW